MEHNYFLLLILTVFGGIGLIQGEYKLSGYRRVPPRFGRLMGLILIAGAVVSTSTCSTPGATWRLSWPW
jgi:hypothetical protein